MIKKYNDPSQFWSLLWLEGGLTVAEVARLCDRSEQTIRKWIRYENAPAWAMAVVSAYAGFMLHPEWSGWQVLPDGRLFDGDSGESYTTGEIRALFWYRQAFFKARDELALLRQQKKQAEESALFLFNAAND